MGKTSRPSRLTLGTVQLGMAYGLANRTGQPDESTASSVLDAAVASGWSTFDTARAYGDSEARIGRWLAKGGAADIVTKLAPLGDEAPAEAARTSLAASLAALGRRPALVLVHRQDDLARPGVERVLADAVAEGHIGGYGASITTVDGAKRILAASDARALQIPASLADRRHARAGVIADARRRGIVVFARSAFLQGALLMPTTELAAHLVDLAPGLARLDALARDLGRSRRELLLAAMLQDPTVDSVVVGCETPEQVIANATAAALGPLGIEPNPFGDLPDAVLDPWRWPSV